jgi:uncharacterized membrane protein YbhN (UPF0104 family)
MIKAMDGHEAPPSDRVTPGSPPEEMPRARLSRRQVIALAIFVVIAIGVLYGLLPRLAGLKDTWNRLEEGDPWWLVAAFFLECLSFACYVALFRAVFTVGRAGSRIAWRESYQITMAGLAASRLLAAGGAGGVVLTAWALRRSGMERREVAARMTAFMVLLYAVYMLALLLGSLGLRLGILPGPAPFGLTVPPAIFAGVALIGGLAMALVPRDLDARVAQAVSPCSRRARVLRWLAAAPATVGSGVRGALILVRRNDPRLLGAIGGVDGGMIAALIAFGIDDGQAIVAVLSYRFFAFWLPTIPGAIAYLQLVRTVQHWRAEPDTGAEPARALP